MSVRKYGEEGDYMDMSGLVFWLSLFYFWRL